MSLDPYQTEIENNHRAAIEKIYIYPHEQIIKFVEEQILNNKPVFSLISHNTVNKAGFIRWQFNACFL